MNFPKKWIVLGAIVLVLIIMFGSCIHTYNKLVSLNQDVKGQWAKVETAYERRADLIPNLVEDVKAAAVSEKDILTSVIDARSAATKITLSSDDLKDPAKLKAFEDAQNQLGQSLGRLLAVAEKYPDLKSQQGFADLRVTLEQTENRINVERDRFNDTAKAFNVVRDSFPTVLTAGFFSQFGEKAYFQSKAGADIAPTVKF
ncbi:MAG: LemA family protein [Kofleriaceae bacterium]